MINMARGPFGNSNRRQCFNVMILDDSLAEMTEEDFMVNVQFCPGESQPDRVDIDPSSGTTTIIDADRELHEVIGLSRCISSYISCMIGVCR